MTFASGRIILLLMEAQLTSLLMEAQLTCPCGTTIRGTDEEELGEQVQQYLNDEDDGHSNDREQILFMAT